jgi:hypothetical protein
LLVHGEQGISDGELDDGYSVQGGWCWEEVALSLRSVVVSH